MEGSGDVHYDGIKNTVRKKRSLNCRRPRPDSQVGFFEGQDRSPSLVSNLSDDFSKISSDDIPAFDTNPRRKEFSLSQCMSRAATVVEFGRDNYDSRRKGHNKNMRSTEGVLAPANWRNTNRTKDISGLDLEGNDGFNGEISDLVGGSEGKVKKVKLKVGGLSHTIHTNGLSEDGSSRKNARPFAYSGSRSMQNVQGNLDDFNSPQDKKLGLQRYHWKDFNQGKDGSAMGRGKQGEPSGPVRKSKRVPKRRVFDGEFSGDDDDDDEIRYLEKLKSRTVSVSKEDVEESGRSQRKPSEVSNGESSGEGKRRSDKGSDDMDYESASDNENEAVSKNRQKQQSNESLIENKKEMTLTTRQRALASGSGGSNVIEFPDGLPPAPSRRKKEKLTDVEQQLKKAEAAQRRKLQNEKAAKESEAEAIRKILGQDSNRKKREDKIKKLQEELAQEKAAHEERAVTSYIRTIVGPNGTTVSFPEDKVPSLFESKPVSYPPPREKCAGPSCTNPYRYRDSKTKLPLCSLQCYKAIQPPQPDPNATGSSAAT